MLADRYVRIVLTIIAIELGWIAVTRPLPAVAAQAARQAPTPVVITGIDLERTTAGSTLPVAVVGSYRAVPPALSPQIEPLRTSLNQPVRVETLEPLSVQVQGSVIVEANTPLKVENVQNTPSTRPGE